jgi:phenylpropionate dioxygenase-like ring-hydroxylating dioxygenase large terminal subunit
MFLKNAWYAAAWDRDVTQRLQPVTILGDRIVLYRTLNGDPAALEDACAHRKLPLSMGRLNGDAVICGYHGLTYNPHGDCVRMPGMTRIPSSVRVRSYPIVSRYGLLWIWMGAPALADPSTIFPIAHWEDPAWGRSKGESMTVACNYLYVTDNLLDPSHVAWVHQTSFGNDACEEEPVVTTELSDGVLASRWMRDVEVAPFYADLVSFKGRCDRLQHYELHYPSHALIKAVFVPAGVGPDAHAAHPNAMVMDSYNFMTPIDDGRTMYFWIQVRNFSPQDDAMTNTMDERVAAAFAEDRVILEAVHAGCLRSSSRLVNLATDHAPLLFRRTLAGLIEAEGTGTRPYHAGSSASA